MWKLQTKRAEETQRQIQWENKKENNNQRKVKLLSLI